MGLIFHLSDCMKGMGTLGEEMLGEGETQGQSLTL